MKINDVHFDVDAEDVVYELQNQLRLNGIQLLTKIKDSSEDLMVQCPYHGDGTERRPSAGIRKSDGLFHCFACGETHSLIEVISHCFGKDSIGAFGWQWLCKNFATVSVEDRKDIKLDIVRTSTNTDSVQYVSEEELDTYRYYHPYWNKRGITSDYVIELFDLGYDKETKCITFPVRDINGNCLFVARRSVKTKWFNYPRSAIKPIYGLYELYSLDKFPDEVIICESMLDCLSFWEVGMYAVALNGLGSSMQMKQLASMPCRKFILCTDSDSAGMKARRVLRDKIKTKIITEYILPEGRKDANECTAEELKNLEEIF